MDVRMVQPSGVLVDACQAHGVWFDTRELDAICTAAAQRKGLRLPVRMEVAGGTVLAAAAAGAAAAFAVADAEPTGRDSSSGNIALDTVLTAPETVFFGAEAAASAVNDAAGGIDVGDAVEGAGEVAGGALEGAGELVEGAAEAGSGVLEVVTELLGALFD